MRARRTHHILVLGWVEQCFHVSACCNATYVSECEEVKLSSYIEPQTLRYPLPYIPGASLYVYGLRTGNIIVFALMFRCLRRLSIETSREDGSQQSSSPSGALWQTPVLLSRAAVGLSILQMLNLPTSALRVAFPKNKIERPSNNSSLVLPSPGPRHHH